MTYNNYKQLKVKTKKLIPSATTYAKATEIYFRKYDITKTGLNQLILTIASTFIAIRNLPVSYNILGKIVRYRLARIIGKDMKNLSYISFTAYNHCSFLFDTEYTRLINNNYTESEATIQAVGLWIMWEILNRKPETEDEINMIPMAGNLIIKAFQEYWIN